MEDFSGGYYRAKMRVHAYEDGPIIESGLYDYIDRKIYARTNAPVTMRVGLQHGPYFTVGSEVAVPPDVLAIPEKWIEDMNISNEETSNVFLLKPSHSYIINQSIQLSERFDNHNVNNR